MWKPRVAWWAVLLTLTVGLVPAAAVDAAVSSPGGPAQASANRIAQPATARANATGAGALAAAGPTLSVGDVVVHEGNAGTRAAVFTVSLTQAAAATVTVAFATANGTATQPADYTPRSGTLTFTAGQLSKTVSVPVRGDTAAEGDEVFYLNLSSVSGASLGDASGFATVRDDDSGAGLRLAVGDVVVQEGDAGTRAAVFTVSLSQAAAGTVTVAFATANGTATQPADYASRSGTLTFTVGQVGKTVSVPIKGDAAVEGDEVFTLRLSNPTGGATISDASGVGTVADDDVGCPASVIFGQVVSCSIGALGEVDQFTFASVANDTIQARVVRTSGSGLLGLEIRDANGVLRGGCGTGNVYYADRTIRCVVPTAGGQVRVLGSPTTANTGYSLSLQRLNNPGACTAVGFGSLTPGLVNPIGEDDCYPFTSVANALIQARVVRTSGTGLLGLEVYDANGVLWGGCGTGNVYSAERTIQCTVPTAGGHVRVLGSPTTANTGYDLTVQRLN